MSGGGGNGPICDGLADGRDDKLLDGWTAELAEDGVAEMDAERTALWDDDKATLGDTLCDGDKLLDDSPAALDDDMLCEDGDSDWLDDDCIEPSEELDDDGTRLIELDDIAD